MMNTPLSVVIAMRCWYITVQFSLNVRHQPDLEIAVVSEPEEIYYMTFRSFLGIFFPMLIVNAI